MIHPKPHATSRKISGIGYIDFGARYKGYCADITRCVFKKKNNPLHFREVAEFIGPKALSQTVHNELIRDPRFVLVGRGTYALRDWGYEQGVVKDVIKNILKEAKNPLTKEEVLEKVLQQRMVKENTILLNLQNKRYFKKNSEGKYHLS